jgi:lysophospholipase L1-like esterase
MLRLTHVIAATAAALALTAAATVPAVASQRQFVHPSAASGEYYLTIGDSLSVGVQPNAKGVSLPTNQGFADDIYAALKRTDSDLRLYKLGCPGETTATFFKGGICGYKGDVRISLNKPRGNQLSAALAFLHSHAGQVPLITLVLAANDLNPCIALGDIQKIAACLPPVFKAIQANLAKDVGALRAAAPKAMIVGMAYYDPELAAWLTGKSGQTFAAGSVLLARAFNNLIETVYVKTGAHFADMFLAFHTADMTDMVTVPHLGKLPEDVALICKWTWMCAPSPVGPNVHANATGYAVIAATFLAKLHHLHFTI